MTGGELCRIAGVRKRYGASVALELDGLALSRGGFYTLTGRNGAGKSTLLSILALLAPPDEGKLFFEGEEVPWSGGGALRCRREVTLLSQSPYLFTGSVFGNVAFGLRARGVPAGEREEQVQRALEAVGLPGFGRRSARGLSGGEAQRVALARALVLRPKLLLLDEPLAGVESGAVRQLERLFAGIPASGTTVVMATHDPLPACGERLHLENGRLVGFPS